MSAFVLKLLAIVTMTIDHLGAALSWSPEYMEMAALMRAVGRIAFPVYCFLIAEGMRKSRKREMYLLRLLVFAFVSFVPFSLFYTLSSGGYYARPVYVHYNNINVFFTLFLGALAIYAFDFIAQNHKLIIKTWGKWLGLALGLAVGVSLCWLADPLHTDYGFKGALAIFAVYFVMTVKDNQFLRIIPLAAWVILQYKDVERYAAFAMVAPLMIILYDGTHGPKWARKLKMFFYIYYPLHLTVVYWFSLTLE